MKKTIFIKNAAILTGSSLLLRFAGIIFRVWLAAKIGAEGIGLYQLVFSLYMFAATFATSGICTAVTRLVCQEFAVGCKKNIKKIIKTCVVLSCIIAFASISVLYFGAAFIANNLLKDARAALSIKIFAFSLPFMGMCSCFKGYFIARRKATPSSCAQILEQAARIAIIVPLVLRYNSIGLKYTCAVVILGDTLAEIISCAYIYIRYRFDFHSLKDTNNTNNAAKNIVSEISHIALPITSGRYLNSFLRTIETVLVPICLSNSHLHNNGVSLFGMIKGMALPILFFPSTLLSALSTLLLPEISESVTCKKRGVLQCVISQIVKATLLVSIIFSAVFLVFGKEIGVFIYKNESVGFLLSALSPIIPFMYLDALCDGMLKGLDQQKFTFLTSISDSVIRIILVLILLKKFGIYGFICTMYFSNFLTGVLNTGKLLKCSNVKLNIVKNVLLPVCCAFSLCLFSRSILHALGVTSMYFVILNCICCVPIYFLCLYRLNIINLDDINLIKIK